MKMFRLRRSIRILLVFLVVLSQVRIRPGLVITVPVPPGSRGRLPLRIGRTVFFLPGLVIAETLTASRRGSLTGLPGHQVRIRLGLVAMVATHRRAAGDGCPYGLDAPRPSHRGLVITATPTVLGSQREARGSSVEGRDAHLLSIIPVPRRKSMFTFSAVHGTMSGKMG